MVFGLDRTIWVECLSGAPIYPGLPSPDRLSLLPMSPAETSSALHPVLSARCDAPIDRLPLPPSMSEALRPEALLEVSPWPIPPLLMPPNALVAGITFDALGLPEQYFVSPQLHGVLWSNLVGRVLSLQSVLMSSLQLGRFSYAKTTCDDYTTILVAQDCRYVAMLFEPTEIASVPTSVICQWMRQMDEVALERLWDSLATEC